MLIDCHVHIAAGTGDRGTLAPTLRNSLKMKFVRWRFGISGTDEQTEAQLCGRLVEFLDTTAELDAAVILAFDSVYTRDGHPDPKRTAFAVSNDYVLSLTRRHPKMLFGCSVHPYRKDAIAEVERCAKLGAVLLKWLPITQDFDPADSRCFEFYECLAHHKLPLLSHTGWEQMLPQLNMQVADPALLKPALDRGVTVIAAHCGTRSQPSDVDFLPTFMRMAEEYEHLYGDTAALCLPTRSYAFPQILKRPAVRDKLVHGSDWPVISLPPLTQIGLGKSLKAMSDRNWLRRDITIKKYLGFDDAYWGRAAKVLGLENRSDART